MTNYGDLPDFLLDADMNYIQKMQENIKDILAQIPSKDKVVDNVFESLKGGLLGQHKEYYYQIRSLIEGCIQFQYGTYILYDPDTTKPAVIFFPENFLIEDYLYKDNFYRHNVMYILFSYAYDAASDFNLKQARTAITTLATPGGNYMRGRGATLQQIADRMGSRSGKREAVKEVEKKFTSQLWRKTVKGKVVDQVTKRTLENLGRSASRAATKAFLYRAAARAALNIGAILSSKLTGAALNVIWPADLADSTLTGRVKEMALSSISKYCRDNNNIDMYIGLYYKLTAQIKQN